MSNESAVCTVGTACAIPPRLPSMAQPCVCSNPNQTFHNKSSLWGSLQFKTLKGPYILANLNIIGRRKALFFSFLQEGLLFPLTFSDKFSEIYHVLIVLPFEIVHFLQIWRCSKNDSINKACFHPETLIGFCRTMMLKFQILKDFRFMRRKNNIIRENGLLE